MLWQTDGARSNRLGGVIGVRLAAADGVPGHRSVAVRSNAIPFDHLNLDGWRAGGHAQKLQKGKDGGGRRQCVKNFAWKRRGKFAERDIENGLEV